MSLLPLILGEVFFDFDLAASNDRITNLYSIMVRVESIPRNHGPVFDE